MYLFLCLKLCLDTSVMIRDIKKGNLSFTRHFAVSHTGKLLDLRIVLLLGLANSFYICVYCLLYVNCFLKNYLTWTYITHTFMVLCAALEILCTVHVETFWRYNNSPPCLTIKMVSQILVFHRIKQVTQFSPFKFFDHDTKISECIPGANFCQLLSDSFHVRFQSKQCWNLNLQVHRHLFLLQEIQWIHHLES